MNDARYWPGEGTEVNSFQAASHFWKEHERLACFHPPKLKWTCLTNDCAGSAESLLSHYFSDIDVTWLLQTFFLALPKTTFNGQLALSDQRSGD